MCLWAIGLAERLSNELGCRFVVVLTKSESRVKFYMDCGFQECPLNQKKKVNDDPDEAEGRMMYYQLPR
jgi:hypothetical protein